MQAWNPTISIVHDNDAGIWRVNLSAGLLVSGWDAQQFGVAVLAAVQVADHLNAEEQEKG